MKEIIKLKPFFQQRIWGGNALQSWFPNEHLPDKIGEAWAVSAHENGMSIVENTRYAGMTLKDLFEKAPELFGYPKEKEFPLLVKILDAAKDLSVQVHPDDAYGLRIEGEQGKTECWYILDCEPGATIIYGHTAQTKEAFQEMVANNKWNELLVEVPIKKGDFYYVPSGTIHALKAGTLVLEVQQSSDTTYRLYDYDRIDEQTGEKRELHIEKSVDVAMIPHEDAIITSINKLLDGAEDTLLIESAFFDVDKIDVKGKFIYQRNAPYILGTVIDGNGSIAGEKMVKGDSFIIPNTLDEVQCVGNFSMITSHI